MRDGDSLEIGPVAIRLHGIDAPEAGQRCTEVDGSTWPCGDFATNRLAALAHDQLVECEALERDQYGRIIALCTSSGVDLNATMVREGLACAFEEKSLDYVALQSEARLAGVGIWQAPSQPAWEYRADRWERAAAASPRKGCPIKGNINSQGEPIYHTPWSPWYARTKMNTEKGERWLCDEAEAVKEGWRAPRWR